MLIIGLLACCCQNNIKAKQQTIFFCESSYVKFQVVIEKDFNYFYQDTLNDWTDSDYRWRFRDSIKQVVIDVIYGMPS